MRPNIADRFLADLDLADPADLALAFFYFRHFPNLTALDEGEWQRMRDLLDDAGRLAFGSSDNENTYSLVRMVLWELGGSKPLDAETRAPCAPREWLAIFREAHRRGHIGPVAMGAAFRFLVVMTHGNGVPGSHPDSLAARKTILADARRSCPTGLMKDYELEVLAGLPDTVTLYRGECGLKSASIHDRSQSLHWALDRDYAELYAKGRTYDQALRSVAMAGGDVRAADRWWPFLLRVDVPKELIVAYIAAGPYQKQVEVWLDFEKLEPHMVSEDFAVSAHLAA